MALILSLEVFRQLRLWLKSREAVVELSAHPLHLGEIAQLYIAYQPGHLGARKVQIKLVCRQTVEEQYTTHKGESDYRHRTEVIYEAPFKEAELPRPYPTQWEQTLPLVIPLEAPPTVKKPLYDPIAWAVVLRVDKANYPDVELEFPFEVVKSGQPD